MSSILVAIAICTIFGYGFLLGWWARGKALSNLERFNEALMRVERGEVRVVAEGQEEQPDA